MSYRISKRRRFLLFFLGLFLAGLGVGLSTLPELGTSPITSLPYVLTFIFPWTLGMTTIVLNILFIFLQFAILKSRFQWKELGQLPTLFAFGFFIDFGMWIASCYIPENYGLRIVEVLLGCIFLAGGIALQLFADISLMPGDGFIRTVANEYKIPFGKVKICFDTSIVVLALLTSFIYFHNITGVREGTIVAAFLVGLLIRKLQRPMRPVKKWLYVAKTAKASAKAG